MGKTKARIEKNRNVGKHFTKILSRNCDAKSLKKRKFFIRGCCEMLEIRRKTEPV